MGVNFNYIAIACVVNDLNPAIRGIHQGCARCESHRHFDRTFQNLGEIRLYHVELQYVSWMIRGGKLTVADCPDARFNPAI
ncbi:hypothetical protein POX_a01583 [Penicillium oxalicum]|uniref:hypothetical protein n=1 Tax=Penicillium oxalicum TaxID=69781 RepID=UPI0020B6D162|nr:hypothetical protein POX_a01583 [Penicillium oxalicum]KAI2794983.1 hypothetical protein POX_a01583 [Penicillium oxalicum]